MAVPRGERSVGLNVPTGLPEIPSQAGRNALANKLRQRQASVTENARIMQEGLGAVSRVGESIRDYALQGMHRQSQAKGKAAGRALGARFDEQGNLQPITSLPYDRSTTYGQAAANAAIAEYQASVRNIARQKAGEALAAHPADPEAVEKVYSAFSDAQLAQLDPEVRAAVESDVRAIGGGAVSKSHANLVTAQRESRIAEVENDADAILEDQLTRIETGMHSTQGLAESRAKYAAQYQALVDNGDKTETEQRLALETFDQRVRLTTTRTMVQERLDAGDVQGALDMVEDAGDPELTPDLSDEQRGELFDEASRTFDRWNGVRSARERERKLREAELQDATWLSFTKRMFGPDKPTYKELADAQEAGRLSPRGFASLAGNVISEEQARIELRRQQEVADLQIAFEEGRVQWPEVMSQRDQMSVAEWRSFNRTRIARQAEVDKQLQTGRYEAAVMRYRNDLIAKMPWTPSELELHLADQVEATTLQPADANSVLASYRTAWKERMSDQETLRQATVNIESGRGLVTSKEKTAIWDTSGGAGGPLDVLGETDVETLADKLALRTRTLFPANKDTFKKALELGPEQGERVLNLYAAIKSRPGGTAMLARELSTGTLRNLQALQESVASSEDWQKAVDKARQRANSNSSWTRRLDQAFEIPQGQNAKNVLAGKVQQVFDREVDAHDGLFNHLWNMTFGEADPRFQPFVAQAQQYDLDPAGLRLPPGMVEHVTSQAEYYFGAELVDDPDEAIQAGLSDALREWGPEIVDGEKQMVRHPITWYANKQALPPGLKMTTDMIEQDVRLSLRKDRVPTPAGLSSWADAAFKFRLKPDTLNSADGPQYQILYREQGSEQPFEALTLTADDGQLVTQRYRFDFKDSVFGAAYQVAMRRINEQGAFSPGAAGRIMRGIWSDQAAMEEVLDAWQESADTYETLKFLERELQPVGQMMSEYAQDGFWDALVLQSQQMLKPGTQTVEE